MKNFMKRYAPINIIFAILCISLLFLDKSYADTVRLSEQTKHVIIGKHIEYLEDIKGEYTIEDVTKGRASGLFMQSQSDSPSFGFVDSVFWVRFSVSSNMKSVSRWFLELDYPLMDKFHLYEKRKDGTYTVRETGYDYPVSDRELFFRNYVFSLTLRPEETKTYYLRFENKDRIEFPLYIWKPEAFQEYALNENLILGGYLGIIVIMIFYNFFLFLMIKDKIYLYYILYIFAMGLFQWTQQGIVYQYIIPDLFAGMNHYIPYLTIYLLVMLIHFTQSFLITRKHLPAMHRVLNGFKIFFCATIVLPFVANYGFTINVHAIAAVIILVLLLISCVLILKKGYKPAWIYLSAFSSLLMGGVIFALKVTAVIPLNMFTKYALQIGSTIEITLFSLGLGYRINVLKVEQEKMREESLKRQKSMTDSFARFVPKEFLNFLHKENITEVNLGDQVLQEMTVLFSDIRSFTGFSENNTPQDTIDFLNSYFMSIGPLIRKNNGFIDKYIGDAIMALFPYRVDDAINAALSIMQQLHEFNELRKLSENDPINIGIGIHTGQLMLGTIGESDRIETTVISDAVNIASRLEGLNKKLGTNVLITRESFMKAEDHGKYYVKKIGHVRFRGKKGSIEIVEIITDNNS